MGVYVGDGKAWEVERRVGVEAKLEKVVVVVCVCRGWVR